MKLGRIKSLVGASAALVGYQGVAEAVWDSSCTSSCTAECSTSCTTCTSCAGGCSPGSP